MNKNCGIDVKVITRMMNDMDPLNSDARKDSMLSVAKHIDKALLYHRDYHHGFM